MGNKSHNNRCVSFHGRDLLLDTGQSQEIGIQVRGDDDPEKRLSEGCCVVKRH